MAPLPPKASKVQERVLKAAALGSVKVLRGLLGSHSHIISKRGRKLERRASKTSGRKKYERSDYKSSSGKSRKRTRRSSRETRRRGDERKRRELDLESNSDSDCGDGNDAETSESTQLERDSSDSGSNEKTRKKARPFETLCDIVNGRDSDGLSPLHHACYAGSDRAVKYLISKGASVHARDSKGNTPLHIAAKLGLLPLVSRLLRAGGNLEAFNDDGVTPSDILSKTNEPKEEAFEPPQQQDWFNHLADEISDNEWWGENFSEAPEPQEWEDILLEKLAENSQARGLYNEDLFSLRDYLRQEKVRNDEKPEKKPKSKGKAKATDKGEQQRLPEEVKLHKEVITADARSYYKRWQLFSNSYNLCLSYADVPFPVLEGKEETLGQVLLQGIDPAKHRDVLRKEILKWHPDKFLQKWGPKLQGPDHDRIVARVNGISQALHVLYKEPASSK
ncbi:NF-kappa-B inhibitor-like protein 1 [Marchantia polymorpha subsp. ruderalis]|uniref:NF-kappa-B inhibitor-like protein 1 n=2 Tax=Marchantia polymorpha TaxID=3197 RepID=A0A176VVK7_MARPO|nr:hypothetical protein AXG93_2752s1810 [Marchantia polymorpha subsp. ruderalis]PTQ42071.1 hypothetical protein MARPO_0031s0053 [Marchantia polymorpha]PTQ42072.1 hypothetical protein MARPO_0031s0053 [Marchantia polymorpha]BBN01022.1 hypothetical protein Mp_2g03970 [Marchantia polymorpha subsp. ruderalis]BBN01023.1 hypothetical protein Mp_2g03970 [Marchantia polymorpha subsp. ruderalis]|eukprot:PTQ42071.1 hypothetical protein MARPO_0031s0053 [Marchantia polymorpha]